MLTQVSLVAGILWSVLYAHYGIAQTIQTIFSFVFLHFFLVGLLISTSLWCVSLI